MLKLTQYINGAGFFMILLRKNDEIKDKIISASKKHIKGDFFEHGHDFFEIEYILSGSGTYIVNGKTYPIKKNMIFFISPSDFHSLKNCDTDIINVMFPCSICDTQALFGLFSPNTMTFSQLCENDIVLIEQLFNEILSCTDLNYKVQFLRCLLYKITTLLPKEKSNICSHIQSSIIFITENFKKEITLYKTAKIIGLAPAYFSNLFKKETGINFKNYLDNIRFDYVIKLLTFTDMSISDICYESGFCDYSNFNRRFKKKYRLTPLQYRKIHK